MDFEYDECFLIFLDDIIMIKQYIEVPLSITSGPLYRFWVKIKGIILSPLFFIIAILLKVPGASFHMLCMKVGMKLLFSRRISSYNLLFFPMDSTRYFEFHEVWKKIKNTSSKQYLDVSSPRLVPLFLIKSKPEINATLVNPDPNDIRETEHLAKALKIDSHCRLYKGVLSDLKHSSDSFDLITCISVLEHIPKDNEAVETMWSLLKPGGTLILTLPCMSQEFEQYISDNQYGVLSPGNDGYTFWQRYYDNNRLESYIYSITGLPKNISIFGEKRKGLFFRNASMKRLLGPYYPFWREPYIMATEFRSFGSLDDLPGEGVVVLEFQKPETNE